MDTAEAGAAARWEGSAFAFDAVDLLLAQAVVLDALGPDIPGLHPMRGESGSWMRWQVPPAAMIALARATVTPAAVSWRELVEVPLTEQVIDRVGGEWSAEAGRAVSALVAERVARFPMLVSAARAGVVAIDMDVDPVSVAESRVTSLLWLTEPA